MTEIRFATRAAPGRAHNEDSAFALDDLVGVLDGVTHPATVDSGCHHSPSWYVQRLSARIVDAYTTAPGTSLTKILAAAIDAVRSDHGPGCDLNHPGTPAASVCLFRVGAKRADYLVLCDVTLLLDRGDQVEVVLDDRFSTLVRNIRARALVPGSIGTAEHAGRTHQAAVERRRYTNQPDGYWIAAANPQAAYHAVTGTVELTGEARLRRAALLTDGAAAAVESFALMDWRGLLDVLANDGPDDLIRRVRHAEQADRAGQTQPRYKRHDDATAALCLLEGDTP